MTAVRAREVVREAASANGNRTFRILLATDHYPPFIGGAQRQSRLLAHALRERGHTVAVATVWQEDHAAVEDDDGVTVHRLRQLRTIVPRRSGQQHHQPPFADPVTVRALRRLIASFRPQVLHSYGWFSYSCAAALTGSDVPLLLSARDYAYGCANRTLLHRGGPCSGPALVKCLACAGEHYGAPKGWLAATGVLAGRPLLRRKLAGIHSLTTYVDDMMSRDFLNGAANGHGGGKDVVRAIIPSFRVEAESDPDVVDAYVRKLPREPYMLFVGAFRREKGIEELLAAYRALDAPPPLVLIGTRERDTPSEFPLGTVVLENFPHAAVMAAWERCLFGLAPSLWPEPFGSVVSEAMSRGKAVIGTAPGGHTDMIVDGETGILVSRGDVDALADAMRLLLGDAEERARLGRNAAARAEQFNARNVVCRFEDVYRRVVDAR